jgi:hypothetical protein
LSHFFAGFRDFSMSTIISPLSRQNVIQLGQGKSATGHGKIHIEALSQHTQQTHTHKHATLRWGSIGTEVKLLQHMLNRALVPSPCLVEDSDFGDRTEIAVVGFQAAHGLVPDGIVGPLTWGALEPYHDNISSTIAAAITGVAATAPHPAAQTPAAPKQVPSLTGHGGALLARRGGKAVPHFWQADPRWGGCSLGSSNMGCVGCAVTSMAMVLSFYGRDVNPGKLRDFLGRAACPLDWRAACAYPGGPPLRMEWHEEASTRRKRIVQRLNKGLPSIVWVDYKNGAAGDHFLVIVGMMPNGHLIMNDPATPSGNGALHSRDPKNHIETSTQHYKIVDLLCVDSF